MGFWDDLLNGGLDRDFDGDIGECYTTTFPFDVTKIKTVIRKNSKL